MNLYKVFIPEYPSLTQKCEFIIAKQKKEAIKKYLDVLEDINNDIFYSIEVEFICKRDDIIPTIENE